MKPELEGQLQRASKEQLLQLIQQLAVRYPLLHQEIRELLDKLQEPLEVSLKEKTMETAGVEREEAEEPAELDEEMSEDWDFNGDEVEMIRPIHQSVLQPLKREEYQHRIEDYLTRLHRGEPPHVLFEDLNILLDEAEIRAEHHDYQGAMALYTTVLDERLAERHPALTVLFDKAIDDIMPILETLLSEASSNILFDASAPAPLLTPEMRQEWLVRLFNLWVKRLEAHHIEENVPEIILNMAWSEDVTLLRRLVQGELQQQPSSEHSNIVDFTRQYRTRALDKFLRELPHT